MGQSHESPAVAQWSCLSVAILGVSVGALSCPRPLGHHCMQSPVSRDKVEWGEHGQLHVSRTLPISVTPLIYLVTFAFIHWFTTYIYVSASMCLSLCKSLETQNWVKHDSCYRGKESHKHNFETRQDCSSGVVPAPLSLSHSFPKDIQNPFSFCVSSIGSISCSAIRISPECHHRMIRLGPRWWRSYLLVQLSKSLLCFHNQSMCSLEVSPKVSK